MPVQYAMMCYNLTAVGYLNIFFYSMGSGLELSWDTVKVLKSNNNPLKLPYKLCSAMKKLPLESSI